MLFSKLNASVVEVLRTEMEALASKHRGFPFHIRIASRYQSPAYMVGWHIDPHGFKTVAEIDVRLAGCRDGQVYCDATPLRQKAHQGEVVGGLFDGIPHVEQRWRFETVHMPLDARILWLMLETTCDWEKAAAGAVAEVLGS